MDIVVHQKDAVHLLIESEKSIAKELNQYFTFYLDTTNNRLAIFT